MAGGTCTYCVSHGIECTFDNTPTRVKSQFSYTHSPSLPLIELTEVNCSPGRLDRCATKLCATFRRTGEALAKSDSRGKHQEVYKLAALLTSVKLSPGGGSTNPDRTYTEMQDHGSLYEEIPETLNGSLASPSGSLESGSNILKENDSAGESDDEELPLRTGSLTEWLHQLHLDPVWPRFMGKASNVQLVEEALGVKSQVAGIAKDDLQNCLQTLHRPEYWCLRPVSAQYTINRDKLRLCFSGR
jgi:hypothetical protein